MIFHFHRGEKNRVNFANWTWSLDSGLDKVTSRGCFHLSHSLILWFSFQFSCRKYLDPFWKMGEWQLFMVVLTLGQEPSRSLCSPHFSPAFPMLPSCILDPLKRRFSFRQWTVSASWGEHLPHAGCRRCCWLNPSWKPVWAFYSFE